MFLNRVFVRHAVACAVLLSCVLTGPTARSQDADLPVVAIVDVDRIKRESLAANSIREALNAAKERLEADLRTEGEGLKAEEDQLRKQQTILAPEAFTAKRRDLEQRYAELRRRVQESSSLLARARNRAFNTLQGEMYKVLTSQMKDKKISMTMARKSVLIYDERMNITDDVLKQLNAQLPTVDVVFDEQPQ